MSNHIIERHVEKAVANKRLLINIFLDSTFCWLEISLAQEAFHRLVYLEPSRAISYPS